MLTPRTLWDREEIILALDLYFRIPYGQMHFRNVEMIALSDLLTLLGTPRGIVRSPSSVSLKLANLKRLDPDITGTGMKSGNRLEAVIWEEFFPNKALLATAASSIRERVSESRKKAFMSWLESWGKPSGGTYRPRTIQTYAFQLGKSIGEEFSLPESLENLLLVTDMSLLARVFALSRKGSDSKYRRDLRSALEAYVRFVGSAETVSADEHSEGEYEGISRTEGGRKVYISFRTERNTTLRNDAIKIHGTACMACGFDFGHFYGPWGQGFAEVHHLVSLGEDPEKRQTQPAKDLVVLCANCHRMVHRRHGLTLSLAELKAKIDLAKI